MNNLIKITSGTLRGRSIKTPGSKLTHPMGAREKLALFNMVAGDLAEAKVLDAYAGSGALGIEALSRGAKEVVFIEKDAKTCKIIRENLKSLGIDAKVITSDVADFAGPVIFDIIIADPPYDKFEITGVTHLLQFLKQGGKLVLSHPKQAPEFKELELIKSHQYANAHISVYVKR